MGVTWYFNNFRVGVGLEVAQPRGVVLEEASTCGLVQANLHGLIQHVALLVKVFPCHLEQLETILPKTLFNFLQIILLNSKYEHERCGSLSPLTPRNSISKLPFFLPVQVKKLGRQES